jgi:hypothetical protein
VQWIALGSVYQGDACSKLQARSQPYLDVGNLATMSFPIPLASFIGITFPSLYAGLTAQCMLHLTDLPADLVNTAFTLSDSLTFVQPIVDQAPNAKIMARQWLQGYQYGPLWVPPLVIPGTASNALLAISSAQGSVQRLLYTLAALCIFSIMPITFFYMEPGRNGALKWKVQLLLMKDNDFKMMPETSVFMPSAHKHGSTQASRHWAEKEDVRDLILFWRKVNNCRWVLGGLAAMLSGYATFSGVR